MDTSGTSVAAKLDRTHTSAWVAFASYILSPEFDKRLHRACQTQALEFHGTSQLWPDTRECKFFTRPLWKKGARWAAPSSPRQRAHRISTQCDFRRLIRLFQSNRLPHTRIGDDEYFLPIGILESNLFHSRQLARW